MAKFFNQKVQKSKAGFTPNMVVGAVIGILVIIFFGVLISVSKNNKTPKNVTVTLRNDVAVEINNTEVDKTLFFEEITNVKESDIKVDYSKVDFKKVGTYDVVITIYNKEYTTTLQVVDTEAPVLTLKDLYLTSGSTYKAQDFVESCTDNSKNECVVEFYGSSLDQDGQKIDYSKYTEDGSYTVQIIASDESGNKTTPMSATLNLGNGANLEKTCRYGNNEYDSENKIMAIDVTDNGCGLDLNLYQNEEILAPANQIIDDEIEKIKKEFAKIKLTVKNINFTSDIGTILNKTGRGVVGYSIRITISIDNNGTNEVIEDYYLKVDGSREYLVNKYL